MGLAIFGVLMLLMGAVVEAVMGSFRHLFDWGWPRRQRKLRVGGEWVKVIGARVMMTVGVVSLILAAANLGIHWAS